MGCVGCGLFTSDEAPRDNFLGADGVAVNQQSPQQQQQPQHMQPQQQQPQNDEGTTHQSMNNQNIDMSWLLEIGGPMVLFYHPCFYDNVHDIILSMLCMFV